MDPIRPIGPPERDLEPILRVTRSSPDARRERRDPRDDGQRDEQPRRQPDEQPPPPPDDEGGTSLIDVRV
jgi:hypothetical protein